MGIRKFLTIHSSRSIRAAIKNCILAEFSDVQIIESDLGQDTLNFCHEIRRSQRYNHHLSVVLTDIDHFKSVNDTYGHQVGDEVLRIFACCIQQEIRKKIDWVVRSGGEEFLIVLPETNNLGAFRVAERLRETVAEKRIKVAQGDDLGITASFGCACSSFQKKNMDDMPWNA